MHNKLKISSKIIEDNETAVARAISDENYVQGYLLIHSLIESLLRVFLGLEDEKKRFYDLIQAYRSYLVTINYPAMTFVDELEKFNKRRNRIVHDLWKKGYSATNKQAESATTAAVMMYGLFIEWLETFDEHFSERGFELSNDI